MAVANEGFAGEALTLSWPEPGLAWVTLTRAKAMNTLTLEFIRELGDALDRAQTARARVFVISGTGRAFCCGAHLPYFVDAASPVPQNPQGIRDLYVGPIARLFDRLETMPFPTIAAVNGFALGGGCELALSCDLRVMAEQARIGLPEVHVGALPGAGGVQKLQRLVGRGRALDIILTGRHLAAQEALDWGLATLVASDETLAERVRDLAMALMRGGPLALAHAKASIYKSEGVDLNTAREIGLDAVQIVSGSPEWQEGMTAFVEKRAPRFQSHRPGSD